MSGMEMKNLKQLTIVRCLQDKHNIFANNFSIFFFIYVFKQIHNVYH